MQEVKKMVPEPFLSTRGGSSPKCRKNVETRAALSRWAGPFPLAFHAVNLASPLAEHALSENSFEEFDFEV